MPNDRDAASLLDVAAAGRRVCEFITGLEEKDFLADQKTISAVQHQIIVMGEAVKRMSAEFRSLHSSIPWSPIARMRDRLIHGYDEVDLAVVWGTACEAVPRLLLEIEPLLPPGSQR